MLIRVHFLSSPIAFPDALQKPNACLTGANGLPDGSHFCKHLKTRKVYGLTGKTTPGGPIGPAPTQSNPVKASQGQSSLVNPGPPPVQAAGPILFA